jgi:hypothetical protein
MAYIVLVEDNQDVAEVVGDPLRAEGHCCFVIRSKAGAERFLRRVRPDLVVLDLPARWRGRPAARTAIGFGSQGAGDRHIRRHREGGAGRGGRVHVSSENRFGSRTWPRQFKNFWREAEAGSSVIRPA